jgi:hypothetical protein
MDYPVGIDRLFKSGLALGCFESRHAPYRQDGMKRHVEEYLASVADGAEKLRAVALQALNDADLRIVERALAYLFEVGQATDVEVVQPLAAHRDETIQKAARTCLFQLRRRSSE